MAFCNDRCQCGLSCLRSEHNNDQHSCGEFECNSYGSYFEPPINVKLYVIKDGKTNTFLHGRNRVKDVAKAKIYANLGFVRSAITNFSIYESDIIYEIVELAVTNMKVLDESNYKTKKQKKLIYEKKNQLLNQIQNINENIEMLKKQAEQLTNEHNEL